MNLIQWKITFEGRLSRKPFWITLIVQNILFCVIQFILLFLSWGIAVIDRGEVAFLAVPFIGTSMFMSIYYTIWWISLTIRRIHDIGESGWWCIFPIVNLVLCCIKSQPRKNKWGPNPNKQAPVPATAALAMQFPMLNQSSVMCPACGGRGVNAFGHICPACGGSGIAAAPVPASAPTMCPVCGGRGENAPGHTCPACGGSGIADAPCTCERPDHVSCV